MTGRKDEIVCALVRRFNLTYPVDLNLPLPADFQAVKLSLLAKPLHSILYPNTILYYLIRCLQN